MASALRLSCLAVMTALLLSSCSNDPYPASRPGDGAVLYRSFHEPPKDLDPQRTYTVADGSFVSTCYERLLGYAYLERPLTLEPELATTVPVARETCDASGKLTSVTYRFTLRRGVRFIDDPCFPGGAGREVTADDFLFALKRVADPKTSCPVADSFAHIDGFAEFRKRVAALRKEAQDSGRNEDLDPLPLPDLYARAGELRGVRVTGSHAFDIVLHDRYPQILYWLAMRFVSAIPWEAVDYYDGQQHPGEPEKRPEFAQHPVGTGPYRFDWAEYNRRARIVLVRNETWWGASEPNPRVLGTCFPMKPGERSDVELGIWTPAAAGQPIPQIDRVEWYLERESLAKFTKFLQGYYDVSGIPNENFNQVIENEQLTPEMAAKGIRLVKDYGLDVYYIGFNMNDDTIGAPVTFKNPEFEKDRKARLVRNRKIRQAMALAIDKQEYLRIFFNNLGIPAQSPLPPGMFGYDPAYRNPYARFDPELTRARQLMAEAGLENGIDPDTGKPLKLTYDAGSATTRARAVYNFFIDSWKKLGVDVELAATDYNKFQEKMHKGSFQIFSWGWLADYPDPENFLFLLYGPNSGKYDGHNPNHAWYENPRYDFLFKKMETLRNEESATWEETGADGATRTVTLTRLEIIREMVKLFEEDCPWVPLFHSEDYILYHAWLQRVKPHPITGSHFRNYHVDHETRARLRREWNRPVLWPLWVVAAAAVVFLIPAVVTIRRERR